MPKYQVSEVRAIYVQEFYEVEAASVEEATDVYLEGDYEYLGHELLDNVGFLDSADLTVEASEIRPLIVHPTPPCS
jgi:hypothetical protein